jgi:hypothetical protein
MSITLPADYPVITSTTDLRRGFMLSPNVSLDALTIGVVNTSTYPFKSVNSSPLPDVINPDTSSDSGRTCPIPEPWKIAQNLQYLAAGVLEPLIAEYRHDLTIFSAFQNPQFVSSGSGDLSSKHFTGEAVDIFLDSKEGNMFIAAGDILQLIGGAVSEFGLIFASRSWIHLGINGPNQSSVAQPVEQRLYTRDMETGQSFSGLFPSRGTYVPSTASLNKPLDLVEWGDFTHPPFGYL